MSLFKVLEKGGGLPGGSHIFENSFSGIITAQILGCNLMSVKGVGDSIYAKIYLKSSIVQYRK